MFFITFLISKWSQNAILPLCIFFCSVFLCNLGHFDIRNVIRNKYIKADQAYSVTFRIADNQIKSYISVLSDLFYWKKKENQMLFASMYVTKPNVNQTWKTLAQKNCPPYQGENVCVVRRYMYLHTTFLGRYITKKDHWSNKWRDVILLFNITLPTPSLPPARFPKNIRSGKNKHDYCNLWILESV